MSYLITNDTAAALTLSLVSLPVCKSEQILQILMIKARIVTYLLKSECMFICLGSGKYTEMIISFNILQFMKKLSMLLSAYSEQKQWTFKETVHSS